MLPDPLPASSSRPGWSLGARRRHRARRRAWAGPSPAGAARRRTARRPPGARRSGPTRRVLGVLLVAVPGRLAVRPPRRDHPAAAPHLRRHAGAGLRGRHLAGAEGGGAARAGPAAGGRPGLLDPGLVAGGRAASTSSSSTGATTSGPTPSSPPAFGRIPRFLALWEGGLVFYGGFIAAALAAAVYLRVKKMPFLALGRHAHPLGGLRPLPGAARLLLGRLLLGAQLRRRRCPGRPTSRPSRSPSSRWPRGPTRPRFIAPDHLHTARHPPDPALRVARRAAALRLPGRLAAAPQALPRAGDGGLAHALRACCAPSPRPSAATWSAACTWGSASGSGPPSASSPPALAIWVVGSRATRKAVAALPES